MRDETLTLEQRRRLGSAERLKLDRLPWWVHAVGLGAPLLVLLFFVGVFLAYRDVPVWDNWRPAGELDNPQYNERIYRDSVVRTRMNTWSNVGYLGFGCYAIALAIHDWQTRRPLERGYLAHAPVQSLLFGVAGVYLGLGSGFFHASLTRCGQQCDVGGMYATMICMAGIALGSWLPRLEEPWGRRWLPTWPVLAVAIVYGSAYFTYYKWDYSFGKISTYLGAVLWAFAAVSLLQPGKRLQLRWFVAAFAAIVIGSEIRDLDIEGRFSSPDSIFQGHAVWHLVSCLLYVFMFCYFRSEERASSTT
ncbi:Ceramidase [Posidoniimonas polymericola]|uniref:Ceramidase n=1 Tax=Posidoniimonas polymericola TaxID=2528002 RepID=A0A5C5YDJ3_9BACT|nr:ceramidase [Posidoniimonas polymericola]TWT73796.1 Ceramidase [Posidoniimonas polymericola]